MDLIPYPLLDLTNIYYAIVNYLESFRLSSDSYLAKISETLLGSKGKDLTAVDGILLTASTTGVLLFTSNPYVGIPLVLVGYIPMSIRRGPLGAALPSMVVYTAVSNPQLGIKLAQEAAETIGDTAREAVKLGFTVTGVLVTTGGTIVAYIFSSKETRKKKIHK